MLAGSKQVDDVADSSSQSLKIIATARLDYVKGLDTLIRAISIAKKSVDVRLDIYGSGPLKKNLCLLINKLGLNNHVSIHNYLFDLSDAYKKADLYVNSSRHEYLSISILEALSYSLPYSSPMWEEILIKIITMAYLFHLKTRKQWQMHYSIIN